MGAVAALTGARGGRTRSARGEELHVADGLVNKTVESKHGKSAFKAAKKGRKAFKKWVDSLFNWNPLKWAVKAAPAYVIDEVISYLISNFQYRRRETHPL